MAGRRLPPQPRPPSPVGEQPNPTSFTGPRPAKSRTEHLGLPVRSSSGGPARPRGCRPGERRERAGMVERSHLGDHPADADPRKGARAHRRVRRQGPPRRRRGRAGCRRVPPGSPSSTRRCRAGRSAPPGGRRRRGARRARRARRASSSRVGCLGARFRHRRTFDWLSVQKVILSHDGSLVGRARLSRTRSVSALRTTAIRAERCQTERPDGSRTTAQVRPSAILVAPRPINRATRPRRHLFRYPSEIVPRSRQRLASRPKAAPPDREAP